MPALSLVLGSITRSFETSFIRMFVKLRVMSQKHPQCAVRTTYIGWIRKYSASHLKEGPVLIRIRGPSLHRGAVNPGQHMPNGVVACY